MITVTDYRLPPEPGPVDAFPDLTSMYKTTLGRGLATTGRPSVTRFWRLGTLGDTNVFTKPTIPVSRIKGSVALLWDYSSSQSGFEPALRHSLSVIGASLMRCGLSVWAGGYTTTHNGIGIFEVSGWNDRWDHKRVATLKHVNMGNTPTGAAMAWVRKYILPRAPHHRKLFLVCTDGQPGDPDVVELEVKRARRMGSTVCAIYVGGDAKSALPSLEAQYEKRYSFAATTREQIPIVVNAVLGRIAGETLRR